MIVLLQNSVQQKIMLKQSQILVCFLYLDSDLLVTYLLSVFLFSCSSMMDSCARKRKDPSCTKYEY